MTKIVAASRAAGVILLLWLSLAMLPSRAVGEQRSAAADAIVITDYEWTDARRDREVPVRIYAPKSATGPFPIVIFSHGLGGSRQGYGFLGRHWAEHGYVSVHLQHLGSDDAVWKGQVRPREALKKSLLNPRGVIDRPLDVRFAVDQLTALSKTDAAWNGRLDLDRIGIAGHSYGAFTSQAVAGQTFLGLAGREFSLPDPRIKAAVMMSPNPPRKRDQLETQFKTIRIPCLHLTGTRDESPINDTRPEERRIPFDHIRGVDQYFIDFEGGDHMIFSGARRGPRAGREQDAEFHRHILAATTAFWDAYLKGQAHSRDWLQTGGLQSTLGGIAKLEIKRAAD